MKNVWKDYGDKNDESKEEYTINRKKRVLKVLQIAGVDPKSYVTAVRESSRKGMNIILARDVDEIYINNYNPEWIQAWDANLDIQPCLDFFAVITYITEYFTKDESGTSTFLNQAARKCAELGQIEQKRCMKNTFLTHREMGISEAFMKLLPEMRFKESSIGTEFFQTGKRTEMSRFIVRADCHEEKTHGQTEIFFTIPNRDGSYYEKPNWIDKYFRRGEPLDKICSSHFVKMYAPLSANNKKERKENPKNNQNEEERDGGGNEAKFHYFIHGTGVPGKVLPQIVELKDPRPKEPKFLTKRKHPKDLRTFKIKQEVDPSRFFLQELMLYTSFDEKTYNEWHDDDK